MIRFILRRKQFFELNGMRTENLTTLDVECPALENALCLGGHGETGYDITELVGAEVLPPFAALPPEDSTDGK